MGYRLLHPHLQKKQSMTGPVEIPKRMRKLKRDRRGYPIPATVLIDSTGKPHFTVHDHAERRRVLRADGCAICGRKLQAERWFVGGPKSAFSIMGAYYDPPMHHECAQYSLKICPYLAAPTYARRLDEKTIKNEPGLVIIAEDRVINERPILFVAIATTGQTVTSDNLIIPKTPYSKIEYWLHGAQLSQAEGEALCKTAEGVMPQ
jgi:hypothetical protein